MGQSGGTAPDVLIVGGGVIGCALAYELVDAGISVLLLEQNRLAGGPGASGASAAILEPLVTAPPTLARLSLESVRGTAELARALMDETGVDAELDRPGALHIAEDDGEAVLLRAYVTAAQALGLPAEWLDGPGVRQAEPLLAPTIVGAAYLPDVYSVYAPRFVQQLAGAAIRRGAQVREGVAVARLCAAGSRVAVVETSDGPAMAGQVILATGAWTRPLAAQLGLHVPVGPQRGQIMALRSVGLTLRHVVHGAGGYLVPKRNGTIVVGATREAVGFDSRVTCAGLAFLAGLAQRLAPSLAGAAFVHAWAGLRPLMLDGSPPLIGRVPGYENAFIAAGHGPMGMTLAIGTARLLVDIMLGRRAAEPSVDPARYAR
jgi:glycine oxidase